jgi:TPR repeat protein
VKWYRKLADQGDARGQYQLGGKYCNGEGAPEDDILAYMWWNLAAAQGDNGAKRYKGLISERMTKEQIAEAQKLSREWLANKQD